MDKPKSEPWKPIFSVLLVTGIGAAVWTLNEAQIIDAYFMQIIEFGCINIMMTVSLGLINGFTGQFSLGHAAFMGIGAYASAIVTVYLLPYAEGPFQVLYLVTALLTGGATAGLCGLLVGIPCLRLKGDYLAIVTLAFGEILRAIIRQIQPLGAARGMTGIPNYSNFIVIYVFLILSILFVRNFVHSLWGRACISIRENEIAASTMGINTYHYKLLSFVCATTIAGVAGGLYSHLVMFIQPDQFSMTKSTDYLVFLYAGGASSISGSIISAMVLTVLPEMMRFLFNWRLVIYAALLVLIMLKLPNGIYGGKEFPVLKLNNYRPSKPAGLEATEVKR